MGLVASKKARHDVQLLSEKVWFHETSTIAFIPFKHTSMSAVHTCFRTALTQAFRPSTSDATAYWTIPTFLVPACTRSRRRPFATSCRRSRSEAVQPIEPGTQPTSKPPSSLSSIGVPSHLTRPHLPPLVDSAIPLPAHNVRANIQPWLVAIEPYLPPRLRKSQSNKTEALVTSAAMAQFLLSARRYSHDILTHLAIEEQRWDVVMWIAKRLASDWKQLYRIPTRIEPFTNALSSHRQHLSLRELTNEPLEPGIAHLASEATRRSLDEITSIPETVDARARLIQRAIGQLWCTLGSSILLAAGDKTKHGLIMHRVLEVLAYFHHMDLIPDSVYAHKPEQDDSALQQPPTLHTLSSQILTALSDAQWRAHEDNVKVATERLNASYFLGHEIPGSRYRVQVTEVAPELWLELVLWSCVHGGWTLEGSAIIEEIASCEAERPWVLVSWKELIQAEQAEQEAIAEKGWNLFGKPEETIRQAELRLRMQRSISSEVVAAIVDGLVHNLRLGVGERGTAPEFIVDRIKILKQFLDRNSLSLGYTTWDSILSRLLESGSIIPERRPEMLLSILDLASDFGSEVNTVNALAKPASTKSDVPYFFEPTTVPISLLHRTMRSFVQSGDITGALTTLKKLQELTDQNKQKSIGHFFEMLKAMPTRHVEPFTSQFPPVEFPAFENQLSTPLLAKFLDLITDAKMYDLGRWFLFSDELDGPLIRPSMYGDFVMAAAIIRFGTMAGEHDLVLKIVNKTSTASNGSGESAKHRMPYEFFTALMCSQIKLHRWASVKGMQNYVLESPGFHVKPEILSHFCAELLRLSKPSAMKGSTRSDACTAFQNMLFTWEALILNDMRNELCCILGILSSIDAEWKRLSSQFLVFSAQQGIKLSTNDFNQILGGVLDGYGSAKGREMVDLWCYTPPRTYESYRAPGGLPTMTKFRSTKSDKYEQRPGNIVVHGASGATLVLLGRIHPNRHTVWAIIRKVQQEVEEVRAQGEEYTAVQRSDMSETVRWASRMLYYMGFDHEDIVRDLGNLVELADLEGRAPGMVGQSDYRTMDWDSEMS